MRSVLRSSVLTLTLVLGLSASLLTGPPASAATSAEWTMARKVNNSREWRGIYRVPFRSGLTERAHRHSRAMATRHLLFHSNLSAVCCYRTIAENVGYGSTLRGIHISMMRSPSHKANIVGRRWTGMGVGVVRAGGRYWVTEIFREGS